MKTRTKTKSELLVEVAELRAKLEEMEKSSHRSEDDERKRDVDTMYNMSRFPEENPNPVMRISVSGELLYANRPAIEMLEAMGWQKGGSLPEVLARSIRDVLEKKTDQGYELLCARNRVFSFALSATAGEGYINLYALDITARKQAEEAMRQGRQDLDRAQEVGQIGSWRMDVLRNVLTWSDENHRIFGVPKGTPLTYETFLGIVHPEDRQYVDTRWQAGLRGEPYDLEHRIVVGQQVKWVREKAYLEFDDAGKLMGGFGITQDISERKLAESKLRESEEGLSALYSSMTEGVAQHEVIYDSGGQVIDYIIRNVNPAFETITGLSKDEIINKNASEIYGTGKAPYLDIYSRVVLSRQAESFETYFPPMKKYFHISVFSPAQGRLATVFEDITERKLAEESLRKVKDELEMRVQERTEELVTSHHRLQQLASQLLQAQEKERKRVAVELHDSLLSELAAMKYLFEAKLMLLKKGQLTDTNEFDNITDIMQKVMKDARGIMNNLRPSILDEMGLIPTIGWLTQEYQKAYSHIQIRKQVEVLEEDISDVLKVVIFRVLQEALNNFAKHGKGDWVDLSLTKSSNTIAFTIRDNGQGFDAENTQKGLGLESMRERVEFSGGKFQIESAINQGTTIRATWNRSNLPGE